MNLLKTTLLGLCIIFSCQAVAQNTYPTQQLAGTWQFVQMDGKDLPKMESSISMTFEAEGKLISQVADKQQIAKWKFDTDNSSLLVSSKLGDEKWKIIQLNNEELIFEDQKKHQLSFKKVKTALSQKKIIQKLDNKSTPVELFGKWQVQTIEGRDVTKQNMFLEIKQDGTVKIIASDKESAGSWEYNTSNSSMLVRSDQTEEWEILSLETQTLKLRDQHRILLLAKKQ